MTTKPASYRWDSSEAAAAYDAAAPAIHPFYEQVQKEILSLLPFGAEEAFELVDLGGGSGRLAERVLERFAGARVTVVDQSAPFLGLAERRLARFAQRAVLVQSRLQDWADCSRVSTKLDRVSEKRGYVAPDVIVSTSAIHHLEPAEKQALYAGCFAALAPGGMFINGDEFRPADDREYLKLNEWWWAQMNAALSDGRIPETFRETLAQWHDRNITRFSEPKKSGDDCLETVETNIRYLRESGFADVQLTWTEKLWSVLVAHKSGY